MTEGLFHLWVKYPAGRVGSCKQLSKTQRFLEFHASLRDTFQSAGKPAWHPEGTDQKRKALGVFAKCLTSLVAGAGFEPTTFGL